MVLLKNKKGLFNTKKFAKNNSSSNLLSQYRDQNTQLLSRFKNMLTYIETLHKADDYEKNKILGFFSSSLDIKWSKGVDGKNALDQIFHSLEYASSRVIAIINELIKELEEENASLTKYLGNLRPDQVDISNEVSDMLISYAQKQHALRLELSTLFPNIEKLEHSVIGYEDVMINDMVSKYISIFEQFKKLVIEDKEIKYLFESFSNIVKYLGKTISNQGKLLSEVEAQKGNDSDAFIFAKNFFEAGRGKVLFSELNEILQKLNGNSYSQADDDLKKKVEKFVEKEIGPLFKGIKDGDDNLVSKLKKSTDEGKIKVLIEGDENNEGFNQLLVALQSKIAQSEDYGEVFAKAKIENLILPTTGRNLQIKSFISKYIKSDKEKDRKDNIVKAINYLKDVLASDSAFENYMDIQVQNPTISGIKKTSSSSSSKAKIDDSKIKEIKSDFEKVYNGIQHFVELLSNHSLTKDNYSDESNKLISLIKLLYLEKYVGKKKVQDFFIDFLEKTNLDKKITDVKGFYTAVQNSISYLNNNYDKNEIEGGLYNNLRLIHSVLSNILN